MDSSSFIQFDVPEYSSTVLSQLNELRLQGKLCDIIVHIQGQPFRAHKAVLAASSPYFRDHSALSTMSGLSISVIKNPNVFEQLLSFCYTGRMSLQLKDVVSFLTAASFLQMQCVIDKCTQILESIHSKISVGDVDSVTVGAEENPESRNGVKDSSFFANPVEISPPYCSQGRQPTASSDLRMETTPSKALRSRLQEEGHSDRGSSGSVSEYEIQIEGDHEQGDLLVRESQITEVKVKMEKSDRPSCSDSSSLGDDGYHTEMVDGEQVVAVNVGSYGSVLQHAYSYSQAASQPTNVSEAFGSLSNSSPSRSMLSCFRGGRARQKRALSVHLHSDLQGLVQGSDSEAMMNNPGYESSPRERSARGHWYPYNERLICIYCGKSFNQKGSLDRHMRLHMGITPFVCKFCGKKYTRKDQLEYHIRGHTDDKPFRCEICGKCFPFQGTLNQHLRKNHPGVAEVRSRIESPERTDVYVEQKLENDASASEMGLDSRMEIHTVSDAPD
ncbi:ZBTB34 isoform 2 [Pan troglodytes]|uniref:Zinc finger and BTB domain-containing protein 34 n=21 Tax=Boreoeutheria TaxID=1437010 RepID=ZBT34_HUMAN|nr:RecName: Full=Zinc finger and BTB domain-containing protein 34 [Homo sapiens]AAI60177.1 Zinc finger and BTB domain containing 34 [synthetic construct]PNI69254.1 ZBTB34 isoform 2 [Pan troglodytes]PNJ45757.1 ZBTB34 isoform 2 [Pongo abelii]KAI2553927.1 zinc finger and BTB domain containing 34 [Homo sapiens]KAI4008456.1 zinc finger and BTB domain containing 34 [Homo sapiens]|eukprot:NP_001092740.1 zinc finger and BTB domain-containing protein 34 [Homo sapiens]